MNAKVRRWHVVVIAAGVAGGLWLLLPPAPPPPPDFTGQGFTSVHARLKGNLDDIPAEARAEFREVTVVPTATGSSDDPAVIAELAALLRTGRPVVVCRCGPLGTLEFRRPDGTSERVLLMPAHDDGSVEFRVMGHGRYRVDRESFLRVVGPLGVPASRWYRSPMADPPAGEAPGER